MVIGYDGTDEGADALALARVLVPEGQGRLVAACVAPLPHLTRNSPELRGRLEGEARAKLAAIEDERLDTRVVVSGSAAKGLFELAEAEDADVLVVGSSHHAGLGAIMPGSVARALLQGAPCAVALAPRGYRNGGTDRLRVIGVGYDASPESEAALDGAIELGLAHKATMRVTTVMPPAIGRDKEISREPTLRDRMQTKLHAAVERCPRELRALPQALTGNPITQLRQELERGVDVLVLGSRGYGPFMRVMAGSVADELMRSAPCPVLVFPRAGEPAAGASTPCVS